MAKILLGPTVIGIRGTVAGITFSQNRGGPYARGHHIPPNPKTGKQSDARNALSSWAKLWKSLSAANKALWDAYAALPAQQLTDSLGQPYYASGANWHTTINTTRAQAGFAATTTPPVAAAPAAPMITTFTFRSTATPGGSNLVFNAADPTLALYKGIFANIVNSIGILTPPAAKFLMTTALVDGTNRIFVHTEFLSKFGTAYVGQRAYVECYNISAEGRKSPSTLMASNAI